MKINMIIQKVLARGATGKSKSGKRVTEKAGKSKTIASPAKPALDHAAQTDGLPVVSSRWGEARSARQRYKKPRDCQGPQPLTASFIQSFLRMQKGLACGACCGAADRRAKTKERKREAERIGRRRHTAKNKSEKECHKI